MPGAQGPRVLLVGAGAVGQVYGHHLQAGGARVAFKVREKYLAVCREGFVLHRLRLGRRRTLRYRADAFASPDELRAGEWDQVWLCVSATALRGEWLGALCDRLGPETTWVLLSPGLADRELLAAHVGPERLVQGMISLVAYAAPLPGEALPPGVAYWLPPLAPSPFSGPRAGAVVQALRAGGCPAREVADAAAQGAQGSALLMPHVAALECAGWSLRRLRRSRELALAAGAAREALAVVAAHRGAPRPPVRRFVRPATSSLLLAVAPRAVPFPLEAYLRVHFTKVGDQTSLMLDEYQRRGEALGVPTPRLSALAERLAAARRGAAVVAPA